MLGTVMKEVGGFVVNMQWWGLWLLLQTGLSQPNLFPKSWHRLYLVSHSSLAAYGSNKTSFSSAASQNLLLVLQQSKSLQTWKSTAKSALNPNRIKHRPPVREEEGRSQTGFSCENKVTQVLGRWSLCLPFALDSQHAGCSHWWTASSSWPSQGAHPWQSPNPSLCPCQLS